MKTKLKLDLYLGIILTLISAYLILDNTVVSSLGYSFRRPNPVGIITLLAMICLIIYVITRLNILVYVLGLLFLALIVTIIMGLHLYMHSVSMLEAVAMFGGLAVGVGLILRSML